ncbi:MAG: amidase [SAR324 cluster bacterium]|nr:amidase [SAR324 cluster bacterium]
MNKEDLCYMPATQMAKAVREKKLSPVEIVDTLLERIESVNPKLNAYVTLTASSARKEARRAEQAVMKKERLGPLHGVPYSIKDLTFTKGIRTMRGSRIYEHFVPDEDPPLVERLRAAGGVLLGKTATPEMGWKGVTDSPLSGITRNPWNLKRTPGGSSGGASAQVAAGLGPLAQGSDGGGSIRIPSGLTGIFGLKPSFGRVPVYPMSSHDALSHAGPMTRTVADAALMLSVMAGPHEADRTSLEAPPEDYVGKLNRGVKGLRVAWSPDLGYAAVDPEVKRLAASAAKVFGELGCKVEQVNPKFGDPSPFFDVLWQAGSAGGLAPYLKRWEKKMDPGLVKVVKLGLKISAAQFIQAQAARHAYWDKVRRFFEKYDLLLTPSLAVTAFAVGRLKPSASKQRHRVAWLDWTPFTFPFNLTHNPAATVPAGFSKEGLPVGLQIVGRRFADMTVLRAARAFEKARPWAHIRPKL